MTAAPARSPVLGLVYAALSGVIAAALLFLPVNFVGYCLIVLVRLERGEELAWQSEVLMTFALLGPLALISLVLLLVPRALYRAAARRVGSRRALLSVGGILVVWHVGLAVVWAMAPARGSGVDPVRDQIWYPVTFAATAGIIGVAMVLRLRIVESSA